MKIKENLVKTKVGRKQGSFLPTRLIVINNDYSAFSSLQSIAAIRLYES